MTHGQLLPPGIQALQVKVERLEIEVARLSREMLRKDKEIDDLKEAKKPTATKKKSIKKEKEERKFDRTQD